MRQMCIRDSDGRVRNPFNEYECGAWYARAMSSYAMLQALTVIQYDAAVSYTHLIEQYEEGDVCMIGPNLPHEWRNDDAYFDKESGLRATCICLFFKRDVYKRQEMLPARSRGQWG